MAAGARIFHEPILQALRCASQYRRVVLTALPEKTSLRFLLAELPRGWHNEEFQRRHWEITGTLPGPNCRPTLTLRLCFVKLNRARGTPGAPVFVSSDKAGDGNFIRRDIGLLVVST